MGQMKNNIFHILTIYNDVWTRSVDSTLKHYFDVPWKYTDAGDL